MKNLLKYFLIVIVVVIIVLVFWFVMFQSKNQKNEITQDYTIKSQGESGKNLIYLKESEGKVKLTVGTTEDNISMQDWNKIIPPVFGKEYTITGLTSKVKDAFLLTENSMENNECYNTQVILVLENGDIKRVMFTRQNRNDDAISVSNEKIKYSNIIKKYIEWSYKNVGSIGHEIMIEGYNDKYMSVCDENQNGYYAEVKYNDDYTDVEIVRTMSSLQEITNEMDF